MMNGNKPIQRSRGLITRRSYQAAKLALQKEQVANTLLPPPPLSILPPPPPPHGTQTPGSIVHYGAAKQKRGECIIIPGRYTINPPRISSGALFPPARNYDKAPHEAERTAIGRRRAVATLAKVLQLADTARILIP
ncbi:unnamed protein product, partial [Iphiclides podalirius]